MSYLINLALEGRTAVVVGAGKVARRKVEGLVQAGACVRVVAPEACREIQDWAAGGQVVWVRERYARAHLEGALLAIGATSDAAVNAQVAEDARDLGVLVNVVDRPALCAFTVPATLRRGELMLAAATSGRCPALASALREELESEYGPEYAEVVSLLGSLREQMIAAGWESFRVRQALISLYRAGLPELIAAGDQEGIQKLVSAFTGL